MSTAPNPATAMARAVTDELVRCGVAHAVLAPGSRSTALILAMDRHDGLRLHVEVDERSSGFLALGIGRVTDRPAAVVTTSGTATANVHPAVVEADAARVPLLVCTTDRPPELHGTGANQTVDQTRLYGVAVREFNDLGAPDDRPEANATWRSTVDRAVATAAGRRGPAGPVHLNLPFREPTVPARDDGRTRAPTAFSHDLEGRPDGAPWTSVASAPRTPAPAELADLAERIRGAERGVVVAAEGTIDGAAVRALAEQAGWPLVAEPTSGARSGPNAIGTAPLLIAAEGFRDARRPDLVVRTGRPVLTRQLHDWLDADVPQVLIDGHGAWWDPARAVGEVLTADVGGTCRALTDRLDAPPEPSAWLQDWRAADRAARGAVDSLLDDLAGPTEPRAARDVATAVPAGTTLVAASSMPIRDLDRFTAPRDATRVVANRGAGGIDGFVSTALGAALVADGPTVALAGDLSLLHDANGFLLRPDPDEPIDCTFVVVNNDGGGIFHLLTQVDEPGFERLFGTPHGRDPADLAALHEIPHHRVDRAAALPGALTEAIGTGGIRLIEVRTDRTENAELHRRLQQEVESALP